MIEGNILKVVHISIIRVIFFFSDVFLIMCMHVCLRGCMYRCVQVSVLLELPVLGAGNHNLGSLQGQCKFLIVEPSL